MNRLTRIISRLRHSYYIRDCSRDCSGTLGVRGIQSAMQTHLTVTVFSHMEYRTILLPVCTSSVLPVHSCRIACDTRIYSTAMRRLRFSQNAPSLTRYARTLRMPVRDGSRSRSSFQNGEVSMGGDMIYDRFDTPAFHPRHYLSTAVTPKLLKSESYRSPTRFERWKTRKHFKFMMRSANTKGNKNRSRRQLDFVRIIMMNKPRANGNAAFWKIFLMIFSFNVCAKKLSLNILWTMFFRGWIQ